MKMRHIVVTWENEMGVELIGTLDSLSEKELLKLQGKVKKQLDYRSGKSTPKEAKVS